MPVVVQADLAEWSLTLTPAQIAPGQAVQLVIHNHGALPHALAVEGDDSYQETDAIGSQETTTLFLVAPPGGTLTLYCPLSYGQHRALGQEALLEVGTAEDPVAIASAAATPDAADTGAGDLA